MEVTVFDTSVASQNLGDKIIMASVTDQVRQLFDYPRLFNVPTHDGIGDGSYKCIQRSDISFVGGTNLLSSNMLKYRQWNIQLRDARHLNQAVLLGVGWWQYQEDPGMYTKFLLKRVLSGDHIHSVRDSYTKEMLERAGITNVINTGCPTMWGLTPKHCNAIPEDKGDEVIFTLTNYNRDEDNDKEMIKMLEHEYDRLHFWPQGADDWSYLKSLFEKRDVNIIKPTVSAYSSFLDSRDSLDYVGTRLHGGIHALNHKIRSIIIGIDNRALEKEDDFGLNVVKRGHINELRRMINENIETDLDVPFDRIDRWKAQFVE